MLTHIMSAVNCSGAASGSAAVPEQQSVMCSLSIGPLSQWLKRPSKRIPDLCVSIDRSTAAQESPPGKAGLWMHILQADLMLDPGQDVCINSDFHTPVIVTSHDVQIHLKATKSRHNTVRCKLWLKSSIEAVALGCLTLLRALSGSATCQLQQPPKAVQR